MNRTAVLVPHYNNLHGLEVSISSIATGERVDIIIVDDGSLERPDSDRLEAVCKADGVIEVILLESNVGIEGALNAALCLADSLNYKYVARLDAGDIVVSNRFCKQEQFLEQNPEVKIVGGLVDILDDRGNYLYTLKHPEKTADIRKASRRYNPFVHPAVMMDLSIVMKYGGYPTEFPALEDWALFLRILHEHEVANPPFNVLKYIIDPDSISSRKRFTQNYSKLRLLLSTFDYTLNSSAGVAKAVLLLLSPRGLLTVIKKLIFR